MFLDPRRSAWRARNGKAARQPLLSLQASKWTDKAPLHPNLASRRLNPLSHEMNILSRASTAIGSLERRAHRRFSYPALQLEIDGKRFKTTDWSLGGFRINGYINGYRGVPKIGDRLSGHIKSLNSSAPGTFVAEVVRIAETGEIGLRLLEITPAVFLAMAGLKDY